MDTRQVEEISVGNVGPGVLKVSVQVHVGTLWQARLWSLRWLLMMAAGLLGATIDFEEGNG